MKYYTMSELAEEALREKIVSGEFRPGMRLIPGNLEKELNLGRVPIREAVKKLAGQGLVVFHTNKGAEVAPKISNEEMEQVFELRYVLEGKAAFHAALHITPEEVDALEILNEKTRTATDPKDYYRYNRQFHLDLYRASNWHFLFGTITELYDRLLTVRSKYPPDLVKASAFAEEHAAILDALRARDGERAMKKTQEHISWLHDAMKSKVKN